MRFVGDIVAVAVAVDIVVANVSLSCGVGICVVGGSSSGVVVCIGDDDTHQRICRSLSSLDLVTKRRWESSSPFMTTTKVAGRTQFGSDEVFAAGPLS